MMMSKPLFDEKLALTKLDDVQKMLEVPIKHSSQLKDEETKTDSDSLFGEFIIPNKFINKYLYLV